LVRTLQPLKFFDGTQHVPAGVVGCAVLAWGGAAPGWVAEFIGHGVAGLRAADEGAVWCRVRAKRVRSAAPCPT